MSPYTYWRRDRLPQAAGAYVVDVSFSLILSHLLVAGYPGFVPHPRIHCTKVADLLTPIVEKRLRLFDERAVHRFLQ
jgi:hypothetical protein